MKNFLKFQKKELISHLVYEKISKLDKNNSKIFKKMSLQELKHYKLFSTITKKEIKLNTIEKIKIFFIVALFLIFGPKFVYFLLERDEESDIEEYKKILKNLDEEEKRKILEEIIKDEIKHEKELLRLIKDKRAENIDSVVLGMNDALVEITGALMGLAGLLNNNLKIAFSGLITGVAASLSMAASAYFSKKAETNDSKKALISAIYTGFSYILTVSFLVLPFFIFKNKIISIFLTLFNVVLIIAIYSYYVHVVKGNNFKKEFITMTSVSFLVSALSFLLGKLSEYLFLQ